MFKILKRIIITLLTIELTLILLMGGVLFWTFKHPRETWHFIETRVLPSDLKVTWEELNFTGAKEKGFSIYFDWEVRGLLITKQNPAWRIPIDELHVKASTLISKSEKKLILHDLTILSTSPISISPDPNAPDSTPHNIFQYFQSAIEKIELVHRYVVFENVQFDVKEFQLQSKNDAPLMISFQLQPQSVKSMAESFIYNGRLSSSRQAPIALRTSGTLSLQNLESENAFFTSQTSFEGFSVKTIQDLSLQNKDHTTTLSSKGPTNFDKGDLHLRIKSQASLLINSRQATTNLTADVAGIPGPLVSINQLHFHLETPLEKDLFWSEKPSDFTLKGPVSIFFVDKDMRKPFEDSCQCKIPEILKADFKGQIWLAELFQKPATQKPLLETHLNIEGIDNKLISLDLAADLKIEKKQSDYLYSPSLDCKASINNFQGFRKFLDAKNILIPAPFNILDGRLDLLAHGPVTSTAKDFTLPLSVTANLNSAHQEVKLKTQTDIRVSSNFKEIFVDILASIDSLQLELPPLDPMKGKPRVTVDRRILRIPPVTTKKEPQVKVYFTLEVQTAKPGAIRLLSPYFHPNLPLTLAINQNQKHKNSGFLQAEPFQIEYLRRKVQVEKMHIDFPASEKEVIPVDARFRINQTQYTITIDVTGPINKPNIVMNSEPYLSESEIISVLLYDRTSNELSSGDAETAGGVQAAVADRAIGLFGLWAFAATPIKSFSYNPVTKVYTATVALTDDVTAGIGTNWEESTRLELRKRVSKSWMLTAAWSPATQEEQQSTKLVLQWEKRF